MRSPGIPERAVAARGAQLVHLGVEAGAQDPALLEAGGRIVHQRLRQQRVEVVQRIAALERRREQRRARAGQFRPERREGGGGFPKSHQVPRRGAPGRGPRGQPLEVAHPAQRRAQRRAQRAVPGELLDGGGPLPDGDRVAQRRHEP